MNIIGLELRNFRNYKDISIDFGSDVSVLFGENGQGKTNILEAVYLCSCLRSHRTSKDSDLINRDEKFYNVKIDFFEKKDEKGKPLFIENIDILYSENENGNSLIKKGGRVLKYNESKVDKNSEIIGLFNSVIFAPEDLYIIKDGPSARRRFIDLMISQIRVSYFKELNKFQKILLQRNALLKQMRDGKYDRSYDQIIIWDIAYAASCSKIIKTRMYFIEKINEIASNCHKNISYGKEDILVKYKTISGIDFNTGEEDINNLILNKLKTMFSEDVEKGNTAIGPHRDDMEITINGELIRSFASQGQQRTAVLSLKIAELEIIKNETGKCPVLLLDDVMSELDKKRRKTLLESVGEAQIILTCTDKSHIEEDFLSDNKHRDIKFFEVQNGKILTVK
jgi:DNA replication and repair protein RecF